MNNEQEKHGARVFHVSDTKLLIRQTVKRGKDATDPYVIDEQKERHVDINDDSDIARGIRDAIKGNLTAGKR
jgi:hypothetical protein